MSLRLPDFKTIGTWKRQGCQPYTPAVLFPGNIPGTHFCQSRSQPQGHSTAGRIMSMKNSNETIGNRTRDLPNCSAVPQPTALRRALNTYKLITKFQYKIVYRNTDGVYSTYEVRVPGGEGDRVSCIHFLAHEVHVSNNGDKFAFSSSQVD